MEPEFKHCSNCRWYELAVELEPCKECECGDKWEGREGK